VIVASAAPLSIVPANVYGYAATAGYALQTPDAMANLLAANFVNPVPLLVVSMVAGAIFGFVSAKLAGALSKG
jgi:hypothetical protein